MAAGDSGGWGGAGDESSSEEVRVWDGGVDGAPELEVAAAEGRVMVSGRGVAGGV